MSRAAQLRGEEGQIIPPLIVVLAAMLVFGLMMLQVGLAADFKSRAQTAADAAALAGAVNVKLQIETSSSEFVSPETINWPLACAQAAIYAARNRAHVTSCTHNQFDILVTVRGSDDLQDIGDTDQLDGDTAEARARATPFGLGGGLSGGVSLPPGVGSSGPLHGADPRLKKYADVAARFGLVITAGRDDHSVNTSTGNRSLHADGHALDFGAPGWPSPEAKKKLLDFAEYASKTWGAQLEELIHTPLGGRQINDGHYYVYTGITASQHYNHVHLADVNPGGEDAGPPSGDPGGGGGLPGGGGLGFGLDVHLVRWDGEGGRSPDIPGIPSSVPENLRQMLYNIMLCESSGNPRAIEPPGGNGGALGHYGLFQFDIPTWESVGGTGNPIDASAEEQWMRAVRLYQMRGFSPWECADGGHLGYV
jgi:Transglycosylase-like domain/Putative Flp pilus-assembly TadE/G-like